MKRTLEVLNELENQSVFSSYAIGGAMAATFYTEPVLTWRSGRHAAMKVIDDRGIESLKIVKLE